MGKMKSLFFCEKNWLFLKRQKFQEKGCFFAKIALFIGVFRLFKKKYCNYIFSKNDKKYVRKSTLFGELKNTCYLSTVKENLIFMKVLERLFAEKLLRIKAIKLQPANPFTWASGWKSPFYCDNRKTLSYPQLRTFVKVELTRIIEENFFNVDAIAGVATGAIPQGALVADALSLPFVYVRSKPKDHGLENTIEGDLRPGMKVVVVEDLVSTGSSSLKAVEAIRNNGCEVIGMVASFSYGFDVAKKAFKDAKVELITLTNYEAVLDVALKTGYIDESELPLLQEWRKDPAHWNG